MSESWLSTCIGAARGGAEPLNPLTWSFLRRLNDLPSQKAAVKLVGCTNLFVLRIRNFGSRIKNPILMNLWTRWWKLPTC